MVLPLIPVVTALASGGSLVAHSAGGLIVYSSLTGGYVAGTYISTAALASFLTGTAIAAGTLGTAAIGGAAIWAYGTVAGAAISLIGSAGFLGTTIGATGITGLMMRAGILPSVSILVPVFLGSAAVLVLGAGAIYARRVQKLIAKVLSTPEGQEMKFSNREAKLVERILRSASKTHNCLWRAVMRFFGKRAAAAQ